MSPSKSPDNQASAPMRVGVPKSAEPAAHTTRAGRPKTGRTSAPASQPSTAAEEMENFKPVPVVGRLAWRTQYRLFAVLLVAGLLALAWSTFALSSSFAADRARHQAQVVMLHALLDTDQALAQAISDPSAAGPHLDTALRNGNAAMSQWAAGNAQWQERWTTIQSQIAPLRSALGQVSATDPRMLSAANTARASIAEVGQSLRSTPPVSTEVSRARLLLAVSVAWVMAALVFLLWVHWKQQRLQALTAQADSERMQSSIVSLMDHMRALAEGDLTRKAPVSEDAVGTLADILNTTVEGLRNLARSFKQTSERTHDAVRQTSDTTGLLVDRAREDLASQAANGAEVLRLAEGVRRLAQLAAAVANTSEGARNAVSSGSEAVASARTRIEDIRKLNEEAGNRVGRLALSSREIASIASMLHALADQAGVLADQAALQAVRAGDAGKGFGIVAKGMEDLARQTGDNARKVGTLIETALGDIESARISMADAVSGTDEASRLIDVSNDAGRLAVDRANELATSVQELSSVVSDQDRIANVLDANTKTALARIEDGQLRTQQAAEGVMSLLSSVRELHESADKFRV